MEYEKAAYLRDKKIAVERIGEKQKVSNISENDIDVIGLAKNNLQICIEIFFVRKSKMIGREHYFLNNLNDEAEQEILSNFIKQYYMDRPILPNKIMLKTEIEDKLLISTLLSERAGRKVEIKSPQKGEKLRLVEMAENNARITLENKEKDKISVLTELKELLNLSKLPKKIECFDISNISGTFIVAGMCVMQEGVIKKNLSKRFKIKTVLGQDDFRCMKEVITRRLRHSIDILKEEASNSFGELPDVIFVDGGVLQIRAAKEAISDIQQEILNKNKQYDSTNIDIKVFGMVKNEKHSTRALIDENKSEIPLSNNLMNLITNFQDTVHETAISYHKKLRDREITKSRLDDIYGIGEVKKKQLLKKFGSVEKIVSAREEEIMQIKGINKQLAQKIKQGLIN